MKRPSRLRIGGRWWPVKYPGHIDGAAGLCHFATGHLDILDGQEHFDERDTLLHEVMHAVLAMQGRTTFGNQTEELYVRALATGVIGVLQDNPSFAQWLIQPQPST